MEKILKPFEELEFTDDFMFYQVMQDDSICIEILETLLKTKIDHIERKELQKELRPYYESRGVRFDAYLKDSNRIFNIEMQQVINDELPKRTRYYQSIMDTDMLLKGHDYTDLQETHIIFICKKDPIGEGLPVYTFSTTCSENKNIKLNDKTFKHFFNAEAADNESDVAIKAFLKYIESKESNNTLTDKIKTAVENIKNIQATKGAYMIEHLKIRDAMRRGLEEGIQQGIKQGLSQGIAQQKAKDEAVFAQKDSQISRQNTLLNTKDEQIRQLQARLKAAGLSAEL